MLTATCPHCQAQNALPPRRLLLRLDAGRVTRGELLFTCLACHATAAVEVGVREIATLVTAGVTHLSLSTPPEEKPEHPERPPGGPALTADDLLDLHHRLAADDWIDEAVSPDR